VVRALAFKWIRILFRCWKEHKPYNEDFYREALLRRQPLAGKTSAVQLLEEFKPEVWVPEDVDPERNERHLTERRLYVFARLKAGEPIERARADMTLL
jgi:hypothetical protein